MNNFAVIFDMDGVLIDSVKTGWGAYNELLGHYGVHVPDSEVFQYLGRSLDEQIPMLEKTYGIKINAEDFKSQAEKIKTERAATIKPKPGVKHLLEQLKNAGVPLAVGTSTQKILTELDLNAAGILQYFNVLVTLEDVTAHKPNPDVYLKAAERLGVAPNKCVVFEDAPAGVEAAIAAGMKCVALQTPYVQKEQLSRAAHIVASLREVSVEQLRQLVDQR